MGKSLDLIPSRIEKVVFLSSLHDPYTGRYLHEGWVELVTAAEVNEAIRQMHLQIFGDLLEIDLKELCTELGDHFKSLQGSPREMARLWLEGEPYREMIPASSSLVERAFFISQIRSALSVLVRLSTEAISGEPGASLRQLPGQQSPPRQDN